MAGVDRVPRRGRGRQHHGARGELSAIRTPPHVANGINHDGSDWVGHSFWCGDVIHAAASKVASQPSYGASQKQDKGEGDAAPARMKMSITVPSDLKHLAQQSDASLVVAG